VASLDLSTLQQMDDSLPWESIELTSVARGAPTSTKSDDVTINNSNLFGNLTRGLLHARGDDIMSVAESRNNVSVNGVNVNGSVLHGNINNVSSNCSTSTAPLLIGGESLLESDRGNSSRSREILGYEKSENQSRWSVSNVDKDASKKRDEREAYRFPGKSEFGGRVHDDKSDMGNAAACEEDAILVRDLQMQLHRVTVRSCVCMYVRMCVCVCACMYAPYLSV
jgi:hypothetical protein